MIVGRGKLKWVGNKVTHCLFIHHKSHRSNTWMWALQFSKVHGLFRGTYASILRIKRESNRQAESLVFARSLVHTPWLSTFWVIPLEDYLETSNIDYSLNTEDRITVITSHQIGKCLFHNRKQPLISDKPAQKSVIQKEIWRTGRHMRCIHFAVNHLKYGQHFSRQS
jgi:hypothetical protein